MALSISFHSTIRLEMESHMRNDSHWIEFAAIDFHGNKTRFTMFFDDQVYGRKLAHAINQVNNANPKPKGPYPNCRHPKACPGYCTRDPACSE